LRLFISNCPPIPFFLGGQVFVAIFLPVLVPSPLSYTGPINLALIFCSYLEVTSQRTCTDIRNRLGYCGSYAPKYLLPSSPCKKIMYLPCVIFWPMKCERK
jgi:hypothetical protein